ncbi:hypothetical protein V8E55_001613 [Tylopilus felleus]
MRMKELSSRGATSSTFANGCAWIHLVVAIGAAAILLLTWMGARAHPVLMSETPGRTSLEGGYMRVSTDAPAYVVQTRLLLPRFSSEHTTGYGFQSKVPRHIRQAHEPVWVCDRVADNGSQQQKRTSLKKRLTLIDDLRSPQLVPTVKRVKSKVHWRTYCLENSAMFTARDALRLVSFHQSTSHGDPPKNCIPSTRLIRAHNLRTGASQTRQIHGGAQAARPVAWMALCVTTDVISVVLLAEAWDQPERILEKKNRWCGSNWYNQDDKTINIYIVEGASEYPVWVRKSNE